VQEKIGRSPDVGDAVVYLFHAVRVLHNLNAWFAQATRELVMYPSTESVQQRHEAARFAEVPKVPESDENTPSILRRLREQHGHLLEKPADTIVKPREDVQVQPLERTWRDSVFRD
jgi:hypothetical protein